MRQRDSFRSSLSDWPKNDKEKYALMYAEYGSLKLGEPKRRVWLRRLGFFLVFLVACFGTFAYFLIADGRWP